jgi:hypothetical protein
MATDRFIVRTDNVGDLISEYTTISWACARESVLELMAEEYLSDDPQAATPEDLVEFGYRQGVGHMLMALMAGEARFELTAPPKPVRRRKKTTREE